MSKKTPAMIAVEKRIKLELDKKMLELLKNDSFYLWLNEFTEEMSILTDVEDLEVNEDNIKKVQSIYVFYKMIENYAMKKGIPVSKFNEKIGLYYSIINLDQSYQIGITELNDELIHFCCRCDKDELTTFIDVSDIRNEYYLKKEKELGELKELKKIVINLVDRGISSDEILSFVNDGIKTGKHRQLVKYYKNTD